MSAPPPDYEDLSDSSQTDPSGDVVVWRRSISTTLEHLKLKEAERTGASKFQTKLWLAVGGLVTAAAITGFGWLLSVQERSHAQAQAITRVAERHATHAKTSGHSAATKRINATERRVDRLQLGHKAMSDRIARRERRDLDRHTELLREIRRRVSSRHR